MIGYGVVCEDIADEGKRREKETWADELVIVREVNLQYAPHGRRGILILVFVRAVQEVPIQTPGENVILVEVGAISINPADWHFSSLPVLIGGHFPNWCSLAAQIRN